MVSEIDTKFINEENLSLFMNSILYKAKTTGRNLKKKPQV